MEATSFNHAWGQKYNNERIWIILTGRVRMPMQWTFSRGQMSFAALRMRLRGDSQNNRVN